MSLKKDNANYESEVIDIGYDCGIFIPTSTVPHRRPEDPASHCQIQGTETPRSPLLGVTLVPYATILLHSGAKESRNERR